MLNQTANQRFYLSSITKDLTYDLTLTYYVTGPAKTMHVGKKYTLLFNSITGMEYFHSVTCAKPDNLCTNCENFIGIKR